MRTTIPVASKHGSSAVLNAIAPWIGTGVPTPTQSADVTGPSGSTSSKGRSGSLEGADERYLDMRVRSTTYADFSPAAAHLERPGVRQ